MEEELEVLETDDLEEVEIDLGGDVLENIPTKPQTHLEEDNYEVGDTNIQEE